jgi:hypothetical protein
VRYDFSVLPGTARPPSRRDTVRRSFRFSRIHLVAFVTTACVALPVLADPPDGWQTLSAQRGLCRAYVPQEWKATPESAGGIQDRGGAVTVSLKTGTRSLENMRSYVTAISANVIENSPERLTIRQTGRVGEVFYTFVTPSTDARLTCSCEIMVRKDVAANDPVARQIAGSVGPAS